MDDLLARFSLQDRADEPVGGFSKGMKQRLALARALVHDPELLFLDEPTAGLDPVASRQVHDLVGALRDEGRTVVLCTHHLVEAEALCDRVGVLAKGRLIALGTVRELSGRLLATSPVALSFLGPVTDAVAAAVGAVPGVTVTEREGTAPAVRRPRRRGRRRRDRGRGHGRRPGRLGRAARAHARRGLFRAPGGARMNWRTVRAIATKDLLEVRKNRMAIWSILALSFFLSVGMPLLIGFLPFNAGPSTGDLGPFEALLHLLPPELQDLAMGARMVVLMLGYFLAPLFLIIPLMVAAIVGAESFVGEKERHTLEGLLYTPGNGPRPLRREGARGGRTGRHRGLPQLRDLLGGGEPGHGPDSGRESGSPRISALALAVWVGPAVALLGVSASVLVSTRVDTFLEANQLTGLLSLVIVALMVGQGSGLLLLSLPVLLLVGLVFYGVDVVLIRLGAAIFSRDRLMARA